MGPQTWLRRGRYTSAALHRWVVERKNAGCCHSTRSISEQGADFGLRDSCSGTSCQTSRALGGVSGRLFRGGGCDVDAMGCTGGGHGSWTKRNDWMRARSMYVMYMCIQLSICPHQSKKAREDNLLSPCASERQSPPFFLIERWLLCNEGRDLCIEGREMHAVEEERGYACS